MKIDRKQLRRDIEALAENHGVILAESDLKSIYKRVRYVFENAPTQYVYVVTWKPQGVGGFDWFWKSEDATDKFMSWDSEDEPRLERVEIPAAFTKVDTEAITDWLDHWWYGR